MKTTELIEQLQMLVERHRAQGLEEVTGPHEVFMDLFQQKREPDENTYHWRYLGITGKLEFNEETGCCVLGPQGVWL